jgi:hypothetical protein
MAATAKTPNYTAELTAQIVSDYQAGKDLEAIAEAIGKSVRSVRAKLVREGVYVAVEKPKAQKIDGPTKKELLNDLEQLVPFAVDGFMGATKEAIASLIEHLQPGSEDEAPQGWDVAETAVDEAA